MRFCVWYNVLMAGKVINWEAKEHIEYKKGATWYVVFAIVVLLFIAGSIFFKEWSFLAMVIAATVALLIYVRRPARVLHYSLTKKGLSEGNNLYNLADFRSFGILNEDNNYSIVLTPTKRFSPRLTVYFPEAQGEEIVDLFGSVLPMEPVKLDLIDRLVKMLRI